MAEIEISTVRDRSAKRLWRFSAWSSVRSLPITSIAIVSIVIFAALAAGWIAPHDPNQGSLMMRLRPPAWLQGGDYRYLLGTDELGRDILSRLIYGARISLAVGLLAVVASGTIGVSLGLIAGYVGGWIDAVIMRVTDAALSIPLMLVALLFVVTLGQGFINIVIALVALLWSRYTRVVRGEVLTLKTRDYVALARVAGASNTRIILRHILPNTLNTIVVLMTLQVGTVILIEASLSFLGAGVPPPTAAWGSMIAEGRDFVATAWWLTFFPGLAVTATIVACNLFGDWLRDQLDPQLRRNR